MTDHLPTCPFRCLMTLIPATPWAAAVTPLRCYCGHESCHAFASWTPLQPLNVTRIGKSTPARDSWCNREESTWIDKL